MEHKHKIHELGGLGMAIGKFRCVFLESFNQESMGYRSFRKFYSVKSMSKMICNGNFEIRLF